MADVTLERNIQDSVNLTQAIAQFSAVAAANAVSGIQEYLHKFTSDNFVEFQPTIDLIWTVRAGGSSPRAKPGPGPLRVCQVASLSTY